MINFDFANNNTFQLKMNSFLPLGKVLGPSDIVENEKFLQKLESRNYSKPDAIWGTLGWKNKNVFKPKGQIQFSEKGNFNSTGSCLKEIETVWGFNPLSKSEDFIVKEQFINFDEVEFSFSKTEFTYDQIPQLRLSLFLNPDEGALVYYQHSPKSDFDSDESNIEYILPQRTDTNYTTDRDRLHYYFPIIPPNHTTYNEENGKLYLKDSVVETSFIVKVLTFKRNNLAAPELYQEASSSINLWIGKKHKKEIETQSLSKLNGQNALSKGFHFLGNRKYSLLRYDELLDQFTHVDTTHIDTSKKTLLLIHGTFSSTEGSYGKLYNNEESLLKKLIKHGIFEQIISFDHPTISHDAFDNVRVLYDRLEGLVFEHPVDILSYSRGALVAKWLASDPENTFFSTGNIITFSGANGVGYYKAGKYVSKGLSVMRKIIPGPTAKLITALAQFSAEFFLELPGNQQMTPNNKKLVKILTSNLSNPESRVQTIAVDWNKSLVSNPLKRPFAKVLDGMIKLILGPKHDWVVGFQEQKISPDDIDNPIEITSMHVKNFDLHYVKTNTHDIIYNYFKLKRQVALTV